MTITTLGKTAAQDSPGVNLMPPLVFYACLISGGLLEWIFPHEFPWISRSLRIILGLVLCASGFGFMMVAHETFKRIGTNVPTNLPASAFVTTGAYRYSRNPMYVGGSAFFVGIGLSVGSLWMLAAYIPLELYIALIVIPREEAYMGREYGNEYLAYCRKVRRWL